MMLEISDEDMNVLRGEEMIEHFIDFYKKLLGTKDHCDKFFGLEPYAKRLDSYSAAEMVRNVSNEEIKSVIFEMEDDKASGPDDYSALFFKKAWPVIGDEVCLPIQ